MDFPSIGSLNAQPPGGADMGTFNGCPLIARSCVYTGSFVSEGDSDMENC